MELVLTVNKTFYSNNPIEFDVNRSELCGMPLFCHLSLGRTAFSGLELFGGT